MKRQPKIQYDFINTKDCVKTVFVYYTIRLIISSLCFWLPFNMRLVFRALDVIACGAAYDGITIDEQIRLVAESSVIIADFIFFASSVILFYGVLLNIHRVNTTKDFIIETGYSVGVDGPQGVGKSRLLCYMAMVLVGQKLETTCFKYFLDIPNEENLKKEAAEGNRWGYVHYKAREDAINYYYSEANEGRIPGVYGNLRITYKHKIPYELKKEHFSMLERLYESNVKILSEADNTFANTMRKVSEKAKKDEAKDVTANKIDEFVGLDRQYTDGTLLLDTHANGSVFKSMRDAQQTVLHLTRSEYKYTPRLYKRIYAGLVAKTIAVGKSRFDDMREGNFDKAKKKIKELGKLRKRVKFIEELMRRTGFTRLYYVSENGNVRLRSMSDECFMVLPNEVPYAYDDRILQVNYPYAAKFEQAAKS